MFVLLRLNFLDPTEIRPEKQVQIGIRATRPEQTGFKKEMAGTN